MTQPIKDAASTHWVYKAPASLRPYLQLARYDRPVGYWLLALPGWIGLAFASLSHGFAISDVQWAMLVLIGAIAMRGAGCTYNDIVDRDLDAQVDRTALRPIPAGTVSLKQAWVWLVLQCAVGFIVLLCLPRLAQIIALCSIPLVAAYPFMKRITWWPQVWLGMTFNWAVLVAYAIKTGAINPPVLVLYAGLIFWTIGYDTIYACQDIEDDAMVGIKSTARRFGTRIKVGVGISYFLAFLLASFSGLLSPVYMALGVAEDLNSTLSMFLKYPGFFASLIYGVHLLWQFIKFEPGDKVRALKLFKSNFYAGIGLVIGYACIATLFTPS